MLRVRLYKNCRLTNTYQNVFSKGNYTKDGVTKSVLEHYLDTLSSKFYEIDKVYIENSGTLNFEYSIDSGTIYDFNYMKVEVLDDNLNILFTRYCFIDDIKMKNDIVYLDYSEDIWSSYSDKISGINESYLCRSRVLEYGEHNIGYHNIPVVYDGNEKINMIYTEVTKFSLLVRVQSYTTAREGEPNNREIGYYLLNDIHIADKIDFTFNEILNYITGIIKNQQNNCLWLGGAALYYQVDNFIILPSEWAENIIQTGSVYEFKNFMLGPTYTTIIGGRRLSQVQDIEIYGGTIENNFKNYQFGTLYQKSELINNGTDLKFSVRFIYDIFNVAIFLDMENTLLELTESFLIDPPFNTESGGVLAQKNLERKLKVVNGISQVAVGAIQTGVSLAAIGRGVSLFGTAGTKTTTSTTKFLKKSVKTATSTTATLGKASALDIIGGTASGVGKIVGGITNLIAAEAPVYSSTYGSYVENNALLNAKFGLILYQIESDNDLYVEDTINNTGYLVYEYLDDLNDLKFLQPNYFLNQEIAYDVVQFLNVSVYGKFPQSIAIELNDILANGTKIWYDYLCRQDYLEVR